MNRLPLLFAFLFASTLVSAEAQERPAEPPGAPSASSGSQTDILTLLPPDAETEHVLPTASGDLPYTAKAGAIQLTGQDGQPMAKIFYTSYVARDRSTPRPLTFAFNGGPGAASAYLHLGLMGPKTLQFGHTGDDGRTPELVDNKQSWLAFSDLVFIDPVGTGWSRAINDDKAKNFYGVRQDAESLAKFIALYIQQTDSLGSRKFLVGESYGGFRAAKVASALKDSQGILVSGIAMVSPFLDGRFLDNSDDPISAALQLPSLGAARLERERTFTSGKLAEIERFAMSDYLTTLAGPAPKGARATDFYREVSTITGIAQEAVERARGFVGDIYAKGAVEAGRVVSPYNASYAVADAYPEAPWSRNDDPILDGYTRAYGAVFASYARSALKYSTDMTYTLLNEEVNRRWEWNGGRGGDSRAQASIETDLRDLLSVIPGLRIMIAHGLSDALTPYGVSRYVIDHLPAPVADGRVKLTTYTGGHMFYTNPASQRAFAADAASFYREASGSAEQDTDPR